MQIISSFTLFSSRTERSSVAINLDEFKSVDASKFYESINLGFKLILYLLQLPEQPVLELHSNRSKMTLSDRNYATMPVFTSSGTSKSPR